MILAFGTLLYPALQVAESLDATVVDMRFVKPLDEALLLELAQNHKAFVTVEEGCIMGGAGSAVSEFFHQQQLSPHMLQLGLPDQFIDHGDQQTILAQLGLDAKGMQTSIQTWLDKQ